MRLLLVRHGQTVWNVERRFLGFSDLSLTERGKDQARRFAKDLGQPTDRVFTSPLKRAVQTARAIVDAPVSVLGLAELYQGQLEGLYPHQARARYPDFFARWERDPTHTAVPGGESLGQCGNRAMAALAQVAAQTGVQETAVAVTHQMVIAAVSCLVKGQSLTHWREFTVGHLRGSWLVHNQGRWRMVASDWYPAETARPTSTTKVPR